MAERIATPSDEWCRLRLCTTSHKPSFKPAGVQIQSSFLEHVRVVCSFISWSVGTLLSAVNVLRLGGRQGDSRHDLAHRSETVLLRLRPPLAIIGQSLMATFFSRCLS